MEQLSVKNKFKDLFIHFVPAIIVTALFQVIAIEIYSFNPLHKSKINFFLWSISQAFGSFFLGYISDKFCRKKTLAATQLCGIILILCLIKFGYSNWFLILLTGLTFSPSSIAKAGLIDNFPKISKVRVVGVTFLALLTPWCIFKIIVDSNIFHISLIVLFILIVNLVVTIIFFEDRRDKRQHQKNKHSFFNKKQKHQAILTALALIPAQIIFFLSDSFFEESISSKPFFTMLGIGVFIGAAVSIFYKSVPHISVITICYGIGFTFCLQSLIMTFIVPTPEGILPILIMLFSTGGGFYLPFVYDSILSSVSAQHRGATCGVIESIISLSGIFGLVIILISNPSEIFIFSLMTILFLIATILQKTGEKNVL